MTVKTSHCWDCKHFRAEDPDANYHGYCHRFAPHALDYYGFSGIEIETPLTTKGDVYTFSTEDARLPVGDNGQIIYADSSEATGLKWGDPPTLALPLTTKGDILARTSSDNVRVGVGTDGQVLTSDSAETAGVKWADPTGSASPLTTKGDLYTHNGSADARLPVSATDGYILAADSGEATGQKWIENPGDYFIMALQSSYMGTYTGGDELELKRGGDTTATPPYPVAARYTTYDNVGELPFSVPDNAEVIAAQIHLSKGAVATATVGSNPYIKIYLYEIDGDSDTWLNSIDVVIPAAQVGINSDVGTPDYYTSLTKLATPISGFTPGNFLGVRVPLDDNTDNERIYAIRNLTITLYVRVPLSDVLDSTLLPLAAMAKLATKATENETSADEKTEIAKLAKTVLRSLSPTATTPTSAGKWSYIVDSSTMWCGRFEPRTGEKPATE